MRALVIVNLILLISMSSIAFDGMLHMRFYYSVLEAQSYFQGLGPYEKMLQVWHGLLDCVFIGSFSLLLFRLTRMKLVFIYTAVDYIETLTMMLLALGELSEVPLWLGVTTSLKWILSSAFLLIAGIKTIQKYFLKRTKS